MNGHQLLLEEIGEYMHRFFVEEGQITDNEIYITGKDLKHIRDVLRLKLGEKLEVSSEGYNYLSEITSISTDKIGLNILSKYKGKNESEIKISLYQALAKGSKMDLIVQKCTEVGVHDFTGIISHRTIVKIKDINKEKNKIDRWNMIAEEAAKQSKRDSLPIFRNIQNFDEMIEELKGKDNIIVAYENEEGLSIGNLLKSIRGTVPAGNIMVSLVIGPEGGFEDSEIERLEAIGASIVSLGSRILRTETAGIVASTIILYELGKLGVI